jgi:hypothetical protein
VSASVCGIRRRRHAQKAAGASWTSSFDGNGGSDDAREARWATLWTTEGCVHLGGNAVDDTEALYDG